LAALTNGVRLRDAANGLSGIAQQQRGGLAALELARDTVDPAFLLTKENSGVDYLGWLDAGSYLSAIDDHGSPAYSPDELPTVPEPGRVSADMVSAAALEVELAPGAAAGGACLRLDPGLEPAVFDVPAEGVVLRASRAGTEASLRRYASDSFPVALGPLEPRAPTLLRIPADRSSRPWALQLSGGGPVAACRP
jgi:hypothetical protein